MILGLTGSIGSGKSTTSKIFKNIGLEIYDADLIAKKIIELDETKIEIKKKLGKNFVTKENIVDKNLLKKEVFSNPDKLKILNEIIHPKVISEYLKIYETHINKNKIIIFDIPLLFESGIDKFCDKVLCVDVETEIQIERVKKRDGMTEELIKQIISNQMPQKERNSKSDFVILNNGTLEELENKIIKVIEEIKKGIK